MRYALRLPNVAIYPGSTDRSMPILDLARAAVERGFSGIFLNEHTHIPVDHPRSEFPPGGPIPERYRRFWDPFTSLAFVAAQTGLEIGTAVCLVGEHDPIALAKAIATLDTLSGGRFVFGVGWGWNREEFEDHGFPASERAQVVREKVLLMSALWRDEVASFEGKYVRLSPSNAWPKPHQQPRPPVLLGAPAAERNFARVVEWADGWMPMGSALQNDEFPAQLAVLRQQWEAAGRDPSDLRVTVIQMPVPSATFREVVHRAEALGIDRVLLHLRDESREEVLPLLDAAAAGFAGI
jgi:probable F420-dependent oxidoreductase